MRSVKNEMSREILVEWRRILSFFIGSAVSVGIGAKVQKLRSANQLVRSWSIDPKKVEYNSDLRRSYIQAAQFNR